MMNNSVENNIRRFYRVFKPFATQSDIDTAIQDKIKIDTLYKNLVQERFIPLKAQEDVKFPAQRSKEWFAAREKVASTISGSKPAGWYFDICSRDTYKEHLGYIHLGLKKKFTPEAIKRMNYGTLYEDHAQECFIEYLTKGIESNAYVYETGFQRNTEVNYLGSSPDGLVTEFFAGVIVDSVPSYKYKNEMDHTVLYYNEFGDLDTFMIKGKDKLEFSKQKGTEMNEFMKAKCDRLAKIGQQKYPEAPLTRVYAGRYSVLEIKCPASKLYSQIPYYYYCQLHSEMAAFDITEAYFICWHQKNENEKLRVWKLKFNDAFWRDFLTIVDLFRIKNTDNSRGIVWSIFANHWFNFKRKYSSKGAWENFVTPYFTTRKYCIDRPFIDPYKKTNSD